jgi:hypothetical protein
MNQKKKGTKKTQTKSKQIQTKGKKDKRKEKRENEQNWKAKEETGNSKNKIKNKNMNVSRILGTVQPKRKACVAGFGVWIVPTNKLYIGTAHPYKVETSTQPETIFSLKKKGGREVSTKQKRDRLREKKKKKRRLRVINYSVLCIKIKWKMEEQWN